MNLLRFLWLCCLVVWESVVHPFTTSLIRVRCDVCRKRIFGCIWTDGMRVECLECAKKGNAP